MRFVGQRRFQGNSAPSILRCGAMSLAQDARRLDLVPGHDVLDQLHQFVDLRRWIRDEGDAAIGLALAAGISTISMPIEPC